MSAKESVYEETRAAPESALRDALRVSYATLAWSTLSGIAAVIEGVRTGSLSLGGLGAGVLLDVLSSAVLVWRFRRQRASGEHDHHAEKVAQRVAAVALTLLGVSLIAGGATHLADHAEPEVSGLALALAAASLVVLPLLAGWKYQVAPAVGSDALRTDAHITAVGAAMSSVTLLGLALTATLDWWWADSVAALLIAAAAIFEGSRALLPVRGRKPLAGAARPR